MKILINKNAGVCWGVERAIDMAYETVQKKPGTISSLGPLVHNPEVVHDLERKGVNVIEGVEEASSGTVIFRSHWVPLPLYREAEHVGLHVVDATCPFVKRSQNYARRYSRQGFAVIIVGNKDHPEMKSVESFIEGPYLITMNPKDIESLPADYTVGVIAQTTVPTSSLEKMVEACRQRFKEVKVHDTICDATKVRQEEAADLAKLVDCMVIIGGIHSSNTKKLTQICQVIQPKSYQIEHEREIDFSWFCGIETLGLTAGASTPIPVIERVRDFIQKNSKASVLGEDKAAERRATQAYYEYVEEPDDRERSIPQN